MQHLVNGRPVPQPGPAFEVVRLRAGQKLDGYILSQQIWGYTTHWIKRGKKGFSIECTKGVSTCRCESEELPTRWKGYFHVYDIARMRECFLEITPFVADNLLRHVGERQTFRGLKFTAKRSKGGDNGRLELVTYPYSTAPDGLPDGRDPRPFLERLWALTGMAGGEEDTE